MKKLLPKARATGLVIQELKKEILLYDLENDKALCLNPTLSLIWQNCDGKTSYSNLIKKLESQLNISIEADFIDLALSELNKSKLLNNSSASKYPNISRRKVLMKYALPTVAAPIIMSLVAPTAALASSCTDLPENELCDIGGFIPCCPGLTCTLVAGEGICLPTPAPCTDLPENELCDIGGLIPCCPGLTCTLVAGEGICLPTP